jgi:hypothetical protein
VTKSPQSVVIAVKKVRSHMCHKVAFCGSFRAAGRRDSRFSVVEKSALKRRITVLRWAQKRYLFEAFLYLMRRISRKTYGFQKVTRTRT